MKLADKKKERIAREVISTLVSRFNTFPDNASGNRNAPFHEAFLKAFADKLDGKIPDFPFFISLSSWLHGLSTTLGQSFFENVAHVLSDGEKRNFTPKAKSLLQVTEEQKKTIGDIITELKNGNIAPSLKREDELLQKALQPDKHIDANQFTVDVFIERDGQIIAIELKTVKPNAGEMRSEKQKILEAKAAMFLCYPNKKVYYFMGFPFDPTSSTPTGSDKKRFLASIVDGEKYFDHKEILLAGELWDYLSETPNTMQQILNIINAIAIPKFMDDYNFIRDGKNRLIDPVRYKNILQKWFLYSEVVFVDKEQVILAKNPNLIRKFDQMIFDTSGKYKWDRHDDLCTALHE